MATATVFFIIFFLKPFGFAQVPGNNVFAHASLYALTTFIATSANLLLLPQISPRHFREVHWTLGKELLFMFWIILTIAGANLFLTHFLYEWNLSAGSFFIFLGYTSIVGIFPITILVLLKYIRLLKKHQITALAIEQEIIQEQRSNDQETRFIKLLGDYQNEVLELPAQDLIYISAADNYIRAYYSKEDTVQSIFLRSTLKKAEESLNGYSQFFRCHRTYLINLEKIENVSGNAQGLKLQLKDIAELIPVSRSLNQQLRDQMLLRN